MVPASGLMTFVLSSRPRRPGTAVAHDPEMGPAFRIVREVKCQA